MAVFRPSLRQIEYVLAVSEHHSFSRAAEALFVSQPGLSAQISSLEKQLGVVLFERGRSGCPLTAAGEAFVQRARSVLLDVDDLVLQSRLRSGSVTGVVRVGVIPTIAPYLLSTLTSVVRELWTSVELELVELRTHELVAAVNAGEIDLGILAMPVETGTLRVENLAFDPFVVALPEKHRLNKETQLSLRQLNELTILVLEDGHCLRDHVIDVCRRSSGASHRSAVRTSLCVVTQMVAASDTQSNTATLLPLISVEVEARKGSGVVAIPLNDETSGRTLSAVWRRKDPRVAHFEQLVEVLSQKVTERIDNAVAQLHAGRMKASVQRKAK